MKLPLQVHWNWMLLAGFFFLTGLFVSGCASLKISEDDARWNDDEAICRSARFPEDGFSFSLNAFALSTDLPERLLGKAFETACSNRLDAILSARCDRWMDGLQLDNGAAADVPRESVALGVWINVDFNDRLTPFGLLENLDCQLVVGAKKQDAEALPSRLLTRQSFRVSRPCWVLGEDCVFGGRGRVHPRWFAAVVEEILRDVAERIDVALRVAYPERARVVGSMGDGRFAVACGRGQGVTVGDEAVLLLDSDMHPMRAIARGRVSLVQSGLCVVSVYEQRKGSPVYFADDERKRLDATLAAKRVFAVFLLNRRNEK